ncbi:MAG TPA: serine hydrolase [Candidatus Sulfotelmatobacter sp.]|nr:serine hydrolase [Candidatus Sulfotelmatobacter sp.]
MSLNNSLRTASFPLAILLTWGANVHASPAKPTAEISKVMSTLYERGQFNGAILVAKGGQIVYRNAFGKANLQTGADFTPQTPSDVGSVTKQFTAMAIMMLAGRNELNYDDPAAKYIPEFSRSAHFREMTLRNLLTHTSGIPDYGDLGIDDSGLEPKGLIAALLKKEDLLVNPGLKYRYSNPGYALLAVVVERVSGKSFGMFLGQEIFKPLGMSDTFLYDSRGKKDARAAVGYDQFGQVDDASTTAIPGDGGIYSSVNDLFKWDQSLYTDKLVPQPALTEAFTPGTVEEGTSAYGFGWNVRQDGNDKYVWHTGNQAGFRAFIERRLRERLTVIMLTNRGNSKRQEINTAIQNILAGKSYVLPERSGAEELYKAIHASGIRAALNKYDTLKNGSEYDLGESELNTLGYQLLYGDNKAGNAIAIFELNATVHPKSSNAFDSLGEAYRVNRETNLAINCYKEAVSLDPTNGHAAVMLKELELARAGWVAILMACVLGALILAAILLRRQARAYRRNG